MNIKDLNMDDVKDLLLDPVKRAYVILSATLIFFLLVLFLIILPGVRSYFITSTTQHKIENDIELAKNDISKIPDMEKKLAAIKEEYSGYAAKIPGRKEIGEFLESLATTAGESDIRLLSVTPLEQRKSDEDRSWEHYSDMMVLISAKGGYHHINRFVDYLERGRGFSSVRDFRMQYDPKNPTRHDVDIVLKIYVATGDETNVKK